MPHVLTLNGHLYWLIFFNFEGDGCSKLFLEKAKVNSLILFRQVHGIVCGMGVNWIGLAFVGAQSFGGLLLIGFLEYARRFL